MSTPLYPQLPAPIYFDYQSVAASANISPGDLATLYRLTTAQYDGDLNLAELRLLRTCNAILRGATKVSDAIRAAEDRTEAV